MEHLSTINKQAEQVTDEMKSKYLSFIIDDEKYCLALTYINIIKQIMPITTAPDMPHYVKGVINLREEIIVPIIDMRIRFNKMEAEYNERTCIIIVNVQDLLVGLIVDTVSEVVTFEDKNIIPPPSARSGFTNKYIKSLGKFDDKLYLIIDIEKMFSDDDFGILGDLSL